MTPGGGATSSDIPERADDARRAFRAAFERAPLGSALVDGAGRIAAVNAAFVALWGAGPGRADGDGGASAAEGWVGARLPASDVAGWLPRVLAGETVHLPAVRADAPWAAGGGPRWLAVAAYPLHESADDPAAEARAATPVRWAVVQHEDVTGRVEAERTLDAAHRRLDAALLAGEVGTFDWDLVAQRVSGDDNFARMFGVPLDADRGAPLDRYLDVIHPDDRARVREAIARTVETGAPYEIEYRVGGADGPDAAPRWLLVRAAPERAGGAGAFVRARGVCLDVTARRAAEDELRRRSLLLEAISESTGDVIYAKDRDGRLTYGNRATFALIGKPPELALGRTDAEFLGDPEAARRVMENDRRVMATGEAQELEEEVPRPDGSPRVWASYKMPYRDEHGAVIGLLGVSRDVTERVEARRRLSAALTAGEVGTFEWDIVRDRLYGDANFARMFALTLDADGAAPLQAYLDVIHPDDRAGVVARVARAVETGEPYEAEYRIVSDAGAPPRWVVARGGVERDAESGRAVRFPGTILDVTARKAVEAERERLLHEAEAARAAAEAANAAKSQFLATMSHELRTPLNAIGGYAELLEMEVHGPVSAEQRTALARIRAAQTRLLALINDVLNLARLESGRVEYDLRRVDVADVVRDVVPLIEPQVRAKGLRLAVSLPAPGDGSPPCLAHADRDKLGQVLMNLLSNAVKFTPSTRDDGTRPGQIVVRVARSAPERVAGDGDAGDGIAGEAVVRIEVEDSGIGIPEDKQASIFEPFVQVLTGYAGATEGTGLGLAISRDLMRGMGGDLHARSVEGQGSTFTVTLRCADAAEGAGDPHAGAGGTATADRA